MGLTVAAAPDYLSRVVLTVSSSPSITTALTVMRVHEDGSQHRVISETLEPQLVGGSWSGFDHHAPVNQPVSYTAVAGAQTGASSVVYVLADETRLSHPTDPYLMVVPDAVRAVATRSYDSNAVGFQVLDRALPVHVRDMPRSGETGVLTIKVVSLQQEAAVRALFADGGQILVNGVFRDLGWMWIQPGPISWENPAGFDSFGFRNVTIPYEATTQPDEAADPSWTCDDLAATGWTCTQAATHYADVNGMALDIRIA